MSAISLNTEGKSSSNAVTRTYSPDIVNKQFFLINNAKAPVAFAVTNATHEEKGPHHDTLSDGRIILDTMGYVELRSTGTTDVVFSRFQARHGTSIHDNETLCIVEATG